MKIDANDVARERGPAGLRKLLDDMTAAAPSRKAPPADVERWPVLEPSALHGLAGEVVKTIEPHSESDPVAVLIQFLIAFGSCVGRGAHWLAESDQHHANMFAVLVGKSAKGRKGTSWGCVRRLFTEIGNPWESDCIKSGLSSGEGLIWTIRDPTFKTDRKTKQLVVDDPGISDKRLMLIEPEFSQVLRQAERVGNVLSPLLRMAWESGNLQTLTKNSPAKATGSHVSLCGHITKSELLRCLSATESANGFANRFLWVCVRRSKELPNGGSPSDIDVAVLRGLLKPAVEFAFDQPRLLTRDDAARDLWATEYSKLTAERDGLSASICSRGEAQAMRLSMLFALLDLSDVIRVEHLQAGLSLWRYCEDSAGFIFGTRLGDAVADEIENALRSTPAGMSRTDISSLFGRNKSAGEIGRALAVLKAAGRARHESKSTAGRAGEWWFHT